MSGVSTRMRRVVVERETPFPPEKVWRALTQPHLIEAWLMKNDFEPVAGHRFSLRADWGAVNCEVLAVEPPRSLSYRWDALGLESIVTWTLTPTERGTRLRMEQSGFAPEQERAFRGATAGWPRHIASLESVLQRLDARPSSPH